MSEYPGDPDDQERLTDVDADNLNERLDTIAKSHGLSRSELLEQLISSHWTLNEITRLMEKTKGEADLGETPEVDSPQPFELEELSADERILFTQIAELKETIETLEPEIEVPDTQTDLEKFQDELEALRNDLAALTNRVGTLETMVEAADDTPTKSQFWTLVKEFRSFKETSTDRREALDSRMDEEFTHLETILEYLVDTTEELDAQEESLREELNNHIRATQEKRDQLVALKREASTHDVTEAACESCDTTIDLGLLEEPACPHCQTEFDDVDPASKWLGFSIGEDTLTTADRPLPERDANNDD